MFGLKLSVRGHQHVFQLEIPELQAFHGKIELGPEIIIMAHCSKGSSGSNCLVKYTAVTMRRLEHKKDAARSWACWESMADNWNIS